MLKQIFNSEQLSKVLTPSDVWKWDLAPAYGDIETAIDDIVQYWDTNSLALSPLKSRIVKSKKIFTPDNMEDAFAIKLLDRFVRRIYKVRQSDRNRIIRQLVTLLKDSGNYHILRLDVKDCYESIPFENLITKFPDDLILSPDCIKMLTRIHKDLKTYHGMLGLPRGLAISPTLAELNLETLDKKIAASPNIIFSARYVDDIIILVPSGKEEKVQSNIEKIMTEMGLTLNRNPDKYYSGPSNRAEFDYLGYSIKVKPEQKKPNNVTLKISSSKLNKLKTRIALSLSDHKRESNISLLKRRIEYLSMLKSVRKGKNGDLLAGLAHNYQYVTDEFECLKPIDGFLCKHIASPRFGLTPHEQLKLKSISVYGNTRKRNVGKFSNKQTIRIMRAWNNA